MRPTCLEQYVGQEHLVGEGKPLRIAVESGRLHSMILWGPPGVGKTSFAMLLAEVSGLEFEPISAVLSGVKEIRAAVEKAKMYRQQNGKGTLLFVDEVHRFNKSQQDAFLPYVEDGLFVFVGATTENPSFELNNALLSRARTYILKNLSVENLCLLINNALHDSRGLQSLHLQISDKLIKMLAVTADGDARKALNMLEVASDLAHEVNGQRIITQETLEEVTQSSLKRFDKGGDRFYEQISALHKSVRGSSPDAALYWLCRMLEGGCDPLYIARRLVRMASEDIGNADPRALPLCVSAWQTQERLGSPEGELALAQATVYLAVAAKSNAVYNAFNQCRQAIKQQPDYDVPEHLRNAPTQLMKDQGYGAEYRYAHDEPNAYAAGENYFPEAIQHSEFYQPVNRGLEIKIAEKLELLKKWDLESSLKRYQAGDDYV
jgi:putative ATPase